MTVVHSEDAGPGRPGIVGRSARRGLGQDLKGGDRLGILVKNGWKQDLRLVPVFKAFKSTSTSQSFVNKIPEYFSGSKRWLIKY